jgi:hypothetical protein
VQWGLKSSGGGNANHCLLALYGSISWRQSVTRAENQEYSHVLNNNMQLNLLQHHFSSSTWSEAPLIRKFYCIKNVALGDFFQLINQPSLA